MAKLMIKSFDKPKCCNECPFLKHEWYLGKDYCYVDYWSHVEVEDRDAIRDDCPITEQEDE